MKNYTYEKLHVWKITRMKIYTYWILSSDWCIVIHIYIISGNYWYVLRFIRVTFDTCNLWRILSTSANHNKVKWALSHWGRVTHICVSKIIIIASDNGLSLSRRQAIIWTNAGILLIEHLGTNFSEIVIEIHIFPFKEMHLKMSSAKWRLFGLCLNELRCLK